MTALGLPISDLASRHGGLTPALANAYLEAARVCLDRHHSSPTAFMVRDGLNVLEASVEWEKADERIRSAHSNEIDTTEHGADACVLAAVELSRGFVAVRRAEHASGADYYVAPQGQGAEDLESCFRLEISGLDRGSASQVEARLLQKVLQVEKGNSNLPAMAGVVGFRAALVLLKVIESL